MPNKNNTNLAKTPQFPCFSANVPLKYVKYICTRLYQKSSKISAFWLQASLTVYLETKQSERVAPQSISHKRNVLSIKIHRQAKGCLILVRHSDLLDFFIFYTIIGKTRHRDAAYKKNRFLHTEIRRVNGESPVSSSKSKPQT